MQAQAKSPKQSEFEKTALVHLDSLHSLALRLTRNSPDAEDLVQETCLKAYRFFHRFQPGTNCRAWLLKVMTNIFINRYRQKAKQPETINVQEAEDVRLNQRL